MGDSAWWTLHYRYAGLVHIADLLHNHRAWCILRCTPGISFPTDKGDVALPVTCMSCLAQEHEHLEHKETT